jgi:hypothetical protein
MKSELDLPIIDLESELDKLKPYQRRAIHHLIDTYGFEEAPRKWFESETMSNDMEGFGAPQNHEKSVFNEFSKEIELFICSDKYESDRKKIAMMRDGAATTLGTIISERLGLSPALIIPPLLVVLQTASKIGRRAWCQANSSG